MASLHHEVWKHQTFHDGSYEASLVPSDRPCVEEMSKTHLLVSSGCHIRRNMLTLLVLLNVLDTELSRSKPAECSWRPLALLPCGKKSRQVMTPEAFAKTSIRGNLVYLISSGKVHVRNAAEHICTLRQSTYLFFFNQPKHSKAPWRLVIWQDDGQERRQCVWKKSKCWVCTLNNSPLSHRAWWTASLWHANHNLSVWELSKAGPLQFQFCKWTTFNNL